ncbi:hypothetical protein ANOM_007308 [Aspergillus nomiae NRRL 13137]|uniref:Transcription factor domain-containing protein n=1 Tax=Aspergillus nomiae NRRL (strain ATCC 15546 / NRRL 13137 / CBS 260.88 / M93) TaxID=1509407 RepID=A0A0L1IYI5_ASPN3|nr:uncharacterized protein ANOM_007308 [Aspergillus nomiae NRRL 13137]KNG84567.1 hypothetical protein ANOM_007308 [Aspergillus nomiae NRRL 13137]
MSSTIAVPELPSRRRKPRATDEVLPNNYTEPRAAKSSSSRELTPISKTDPADYVKGLVFNYIYSTYDVALKCSLDEPTALPDDSQRSVGFSSLESLCVDASTIRQLLSVSAAEFVARLSPVEVSYIDKLASDILSHIPCHKSYMPIQDLINLNIPPDRLGLLLSALALCCTYPKHIDSNASAYFLGSRYLFNYCSVKPSLDLCIAYYLQHLYLLKTGPDNQDTTALTMAIRTAHDLKINERGSPDRCILPAKLYLFLYFYDQCCAMSNNTPPLIKTTDYKANVFDHVLEEEPDLRPLFNILVANGQVLEALYGKPCDHSNIYHLEELLGCVSKSARKPMQPFLGLGGTNMNYEAPVQIHMFWARITLRVHRLTLTEDWIPSMSICVRASQMILLLYFQTYNPSMAPGAATNLHKLGLPLLSMEGRMPLTWRQVKRIMASAFILIYAYWHGEVTFEEVCRGTAMALVLHECQRVRWGRGLDGAMAVLRDIAGICGMTILPNMSSLLPDVDLEVLRVIAG